MDVEPLLIPRTTEQGPNRSNPILPCQCLLIRLKFPHGHLLNLLSDCPLHWLLPDSSAQSRGNQPSPPKFQLPRNLVSIETGLGTAALADLDAVLISTAEGMLGLPFLTRCKEFRAKIYITEPACDFGRLLAEELVQLCHLLPRESLIAGVSLKQVKDTKESMMMDIDQLKKASSMTDIISHDQLYSMDDIDHCIDQCTRIRYGQKLVLGDRCEVEAVESGYALGAANWMIKARGLKIAIMNNSSTAQERFTDPLSIRELRGAHICLVTSRLNYGVDFASSLKNLIQKCTTTLNMNGYIVLPSSLHSTSVLDFLDALNTHLLNVQLTKTRLYLISPISKTVFSYVNILSEWMSRRHPAANHALAGHQPVYRLTNNDPSKVGGSAGGGPSTALSSVSSASKRVNHFKWASDPAFAQTVRPPAVVVAAHPSFLLGDVHSLCTFFDQSTNSSRSKKFLKVMCQDPLFPKPLFADPSLKLRGESQVEEVLLDPCLTPTELVRIISEEIRPRVLIMPDYHTYINNESKPESDDCVFLKERQSILTVEQIKRLLNSSPSRSTKTQMITYDEKVVSIDERTLARLARTGMMVAHLVTPDMNPNVVDWSKLDYMNADSIEIPGKIPIHSVFAFTKGFLDLTQAPHPDIDGNLRLITTAQSSTGGEQRSRLKSAVFGLLLGQLWTLEKRQPSKPTGEEIAEWFVGILEEAGIPYGASVLDETVRIDLQPPLSGSMTIPLSYNPHASSQLEHSTNSSSLNSSFCPTPSDAGPQKRPVPSETDFDPRQAKRQATTTSTNHLQLQIPQEQHIQLLIEAVQSRLRSR